MQKAMPKQAQNASKITTYKYTQLLGQTYHRTSIVGQNLVHYWPLESLSLVLMLSIFILLVFTLVRVESKPVPEWLANLSVNALISIYAVIYRASMVLIVSEGI